MAPVRVVVVDDSAVYRMLLSTALGNIADVEVVGRCRDGQALIETIRKEKPDLITLDVEMPVMDGLSTLREIRKLAAQEDSFKHAKVVLVSALTKKGTDTTIQGLNEGAIECIPKPEEGDVEKNKEILGIHLQRVVDLVRAQLRPSVTVSDKPLPTLPKAPAIRFLGAPAVTGLKKPRQRADVILIGVSTGGPAALTNMLPDLCARTSLPILIVQHMPPGFTKSLAESLAKKCKHRVTEAVEGDLVGANQVFIAPGGKHMVVQKTPEGFRIALNGDAPENGCRPAVDVLFRSAAIAYGGKAVAVILTGMGSDGTQGAKPLRDQGVWVIVQDKESSVVWGMPGSAVEAGVADDVQSLSNIPDAVAKASSAL